MGAYERRRASRNRACRGHSKASPEAGLLVDVGATDQDSTRMLLSVRMM